MTAERHIADTTAAQRLAASPDRSVFVSANAGSGKTRVLTNRVARLLLNGVDPSRILCITFTKAAAAEMNNRLFDLLGEWALADDAKLHKALNDLDGDIAAKSIDECRNARRLFARALETPGGLKIQTIHSFCESVLKKFPIEAGIAPGFSVLDETDARTLACAAVDNLAEEARTQPMLGAAFDTISKHLPGRRLHEFLVDCLTRKRREFVIPLDASDGWQTLRTQAELILTAGDPSKPDQVENEIIAALDQFNWLRWRDALAQSSKSYIALSTFVDEYLSADCASEKLSALSRLFITTSGTLRSSLLSADEKKRSPDLDTATTKLQTDFVQMLDQLKAARSLHDTKALLLLLEMSFSNFASRKFARASVDFDDLISLTKRLVQNAEGISWVMHKLDKSIEHILLDEAQDTSPEAWKVIEGPLGEFFSGAGASERPRTFFAVGDKKQSIYSFQGADAALFAQKQHDLGKMISAAAEFDSIPLKASFRTTAPVLQFVDALFSRDEVIENVSDEKPLEHFVTRSEAPGLVEVWPLAPRTKREAPNAWDAPLDAVPAESPMKKLADAVCAKISDWLRSGAILESRGDPIRPDDILVLVQNRGPLFHEIIRALSADGVPVAGADRMKLTDDQGVLDLISFARTALYLGDDLSLAETLKSPFFNFSDQDLIDLAPNRSNPRLWDELLARKGERPEWRNACEKIAAAREMALSEGAVAFFSFLLERGDPSGWNAIASHLGEPTREPLQELLRQAMEFELDRPRSLRLFLSAIERGDGTINRDLDENSQSVRVMTAHKAKGLESNIVFILDGHRLPPSSTGPLFAIDGDDGACVPIFAASENTDIPIFKAAKMASKRYAQEEYRRLLYVAATRARDRLYICGYEHGNKRDPHDCAPGEKSWHALAEDALAHPSLNPQEVGDLWEGKIRRIANFKEKISVPKSLSTSDAAQPSVPGFLYVSAMPEAKSDISTPSHMGMESLPSERSAYSPTRNTLSIARGKAIHRLLELLPEIDPEHRPAAADKILKRSNGEIPGDVRREWVREALAVLSDVEFSDVFAPGSFAEVPIGGLAGTSAGEALEYGVIDRLAITEDRVLIVDYKTNRPPPHDIADIPASYAAQLGAYRNLLRRAFPEKAVRAALLWTYEARLTPVPDELMDAALRRTMA